MSLIETYRSRTPKSEALHRRASDLFPGGVSHNLRAFQPHPLYCRGAQGPRFEDVDGRSYLDLWMGHYALILGHGFAGVRDALLRALESGWHWGMPSEGQILLAQKLRAAVPHLEEMRFCSTGTEATMYAVRLARGVTGKPWILKAAGGWHGASTDLSYAVKPPFEGAEGPGLPSAQEESIGLLSFNDIETSLRVVEACRGRIAGVIVEPMLGAGGFIPARPDYLAFLREVCDQQGAVLIFDEVITGFRFRYGTVAQEYGVTPDLTTLGKVLGGGLPLGVYGGRREILEAASPSARGPARPVLVGGGTFSCNPLSMAAAIATLEALETRGPSLYETLGRRGDAVRLGVLDRFRAAGIPTQCTGRGSLFMTHVLKGDDQTIESPQDLSRKTRTEIRDLELRIALLNHGVYAVHGGGALSDAHGGPEIGAILDAYEKAAVDVRRVLW